MALSLQALGVNARSWLGWQIPIHTDGVHGKARIESIHVAELERRFEEGQVAVVAGRPLNFRCESHFHITIRLTWVNINIASLFEFTQRTFDQSE